MFNGLGNLGVGASAVPQPLVEKSQVGPISYEQIMENLQPTTSYLKPKSTGFWESVKQTAAEPFGTPYTVGEEIEYEQAIRSGAQLSPEELKIAASYGITPQTVAQKYAGQGMFKPAILQPLQPGFTPAQQQSLNPAAYAQQQAAKAKQAAGASKSNQTLLILAAVAVACGVLYFMFKDKE